jgi:hypothetical protein
LNTVEGVEDHRRDEVEPSHVDDSRLLVEGSRDEHGRFVDWQRYVLGVVPQARAAVDGSAFDALDQVIRE